MSKLCLHCGRKLGLLQRIGDSFCSPEHSELYEQGQSTVAFQRVMESGSETHSSTKTVEAPSTQEQHEFDGADWAQAAEALSSAPPPQAVNMAPGGESESADAASAILLPGIQEAQEAALRKDLTAILQVAQQESTVEEVVSEPEYAEVTATESIEATSLTGTPRHRSPGNVWGKAARTLLYEGDEPEIAPLPVADKIPVAAALEVSAPPAEQSKPVRTGKAPSWAVMGAAAGLSILVIGALFYGPLAKKAQAPTTAAVIPKTAAVTPTVAKPPAPAPAAAPIPASAPAIPSKPVMVQSPNPVPATGQSHVSLEANDASWVVACSDNKVLFAKLFTAGSKESIAFTTRAVVKIGRSNAVQVALDGKAVGGPAGAGQVSVIELTPSGSRSLVKDAPDDCTRGL